MGNVLSNEQDLQAHDYTGKGQKAKHGSRIMQKMDEYSSDDEVRSFQEAVVKSRQKEYQKKINAIGKEKKTLNTQYKALRKSISDADLVKNKDNLLMQYELMLDEEKKYQVRVQNAAAKVYERKNEWQRALQARNNQTDKEADETIEKEKEELERLKAKVAEHSEQVEHYGLQRSAMNDATGIFASTKKMYYAKRAASHSADLQKFALKYAAQKEKIDGLLAQKEQVKNTLEAYQQAVYEQQEIQACYEIYNHDFDEFCMLNAKSFAVNADAKTEEEIEEARKNQKYLEAYDKKIQLDAKRAQINENKKQKDAVPEKVKRADVLDMSKTGYKDTVRAIALDGEMYYDRRQLVDTDEEAARLTTDKRVAKSSDVADRVETDEEKILVEEAKIIDQLENLEIFKYINSDNLMEYMEYDEEKADFVFQLLEQQNMAEGKAATPETTISEAQQQEAEKKLKKLLEDYGLGDDTLFEYDKFYKNLGRGFFGGAANIIKALAGMAWYGSLDYVGIGGLKESSQQKKIGNKEAKLNQAYGSSYMAQIVTMLLDTGLLSQMKKANLAMNVDIGEWKLADTGLLSNFELFGATDPSIMMGAGNAIALVINAIKAADHAGTAKEVKEYGKLMKEKGLTRFGRVMDTASAENRAKELEGITDATGAVVSTVLALTGVGGLLITGGVPLIKVLVKKIGTSIIRKGTVKDIIASPEILGGVSYDKNIINKKHFNALFHEVTGVEEPSLLGDVLKVVDGIDLHRAARRSVLTPNVVTDDAMRQLGFTEPAKYDKIKLNDIYKRTGMTEPDWRKVLRNAIEIKGKDYNTNWTRFAKGITFGLYDYKDKTFLSRQELMEQRRKKLAKKSSKKH